MNKINKNLLIVSIVWVGLVVGYGLLYFVNFNFVLTLLYFFLFLFLNFLCFVLFLIFGIINFVKNKDKRVRLKILGIFIVLIGLNIFVIFGLTNIDNFIFKSKEEKMIPIAQNLIEKVKSDNENKYVYFLEDLKKIDSSIDDSYDDGSYVSNFDGDIRVCLSKNNYYVSGLEDNLYVKNDSDYECNFDFYASEGVIYLKQYLENKYDIDFDVESYGSGCAILGPCSFFYQATNAYGTFDVNVENVNNKIVVTEDDYEEHLILLEQVEKFTEDYFNVSDVLLLDNIQIMKTRYVVKDVELEGLDIVVDMSEEDAKKYAESLANYLFKLEYYGDDIFIRKVVNSENMFIFDYLIYENGVMLRK